MQRRLFSALFCLLATLLPAVGYAPAADTKVAQTQAAVAKLKAYDLLQVKSDKHEMADAFLLGYASYYVFPELLGASSTDGNKEFTQKFEAKFTELGMDKVKVIVSSVKGTEAVVMSNKNAVIVVFRGSESGHYRPAIKDWMTNVKVAMLPAHELGKNVRVHTGFYRALDAVYEIVSKEVTAQGGFKNNKRVYVTGHSLGGALALLCGARLYKDLKHKPIIYTFGSPRVGDASFCLACDGLKIHRWVNNLDIVPMMPSDRFQSYRHVGSTHNIGPGGLVSLDAVEKRAWRGVTADHYIAKYLKAFHENLPKDVKEKMPELP